MIQTFFNTDGTGLTAIITVIVDGDHIDPDSWPITNDPAIVLSSHPAAAKTVTAIDTGVFKVVWSSLSPALAHGDVVLIAVDGDISATAWTTWQIPVQCVLLPSTQASVDVIDGIVDSILVDTNELQTNQGNWLTATGFSTHAAADVWTVGTRTVTGGAITTLSGHTPQTGDSFARIGATGSGLTSLATQTSVNTTNDRLGFTLAALAGNCADPQTADETYSIILGANTFTIDHTGLDATGTRTTATLTKS